MADNPKSALELLEQFRTERAELDVLVRALEKRLGIVPAQNSTDSQQSATPRVTVSLDSIPVGFFHNLSLAAAAEKLLRMNPGHPLTTNEIIEALRKSGMEFTSPNAVTILYTALKRSTRFERVAGKAWGMSEWYPSKDKRKQEQPPSKEKADHAHDKE